jgi:uncharacterized membrane protein
VTAGAGFADAEECDMSMRTHELHPALVHAPLTLLPAAAAVDLLAAGRPRDRMLDGLGRTLWWATAASGLLAGLAGMAASQEIELPGETTRDMMFLHGMGNLAVVVSALGVALLRTGRKASYTTAAAGLAATGAAVYTAWLGGELVYTHGAGVTRLGGAQAEAPALFSRAAPGRLARDAVRGLAWLFQRGSRAVRGEQPIQRSALGPLAAAAAPLPTEAVTPPEQRH